MASKPKRPPLDWEAIEREYRAGQLSVKEIARQYKLTDAAILKHCKKMGLTRNLAGLVRVETERKMIEVSAGVSGANAREIVDAAAGRNVRLMVLHREDVCGLRATVKFLAAQLQKASEDRDLITGDIIEETDGEPDRRAAMLRAVSLPTHARTAVELSQAYAKLIPLERQAHNINGISPEDPDKKKFDLSKLTDEQLASLAEAAAISARDP